MVQTARTLTGMVLLLPPLLSLVWSGWLFVSETPLLLWLGLSLLIQLTGGLVTLLVLWILLVMDQDLRQSRQKIADLPPWMFLVGSVYILPALLTVGMVEDMVKTPDRSLRERIRWMSGQAIALFQGILTDIREHHS